ncbi:KR domain-containing protein [Pseudohalioglobus lutimaris]|uniref:KR domain-containing protein n=2 Tax=Pseudohalioglobus lutimaris TaxID=1737061 RepID=A0A2N5X2T3_9GAMM|nr:KR domain-containing protein [Pseudohalioglobus lutimaris]
MMLLEGKVALVTGAGQGVGQGIALALAAEGARVAVTGRTLEKLETTCALIHERGGEAYPVHCQVKSLASLEECVESVVAHFGGLQILVNNAQEVPLGTLQDVTDEAFTAGFESGPLATMRMMKLCYPHLKGDGCIVNLASAAAKRWDMSGYGAYAATKEGIRSLTRAAACEWGGDGIRTNVIMPHATSPGLKWWVENRPEEAAEFVASIPQRRIGDCEEDIGRFVALLCSSGSAYVNGQTIALDGGQAFIG